MNREQLVEIMRQEAEEALAAIEVALVELEGDAGDRVAFRDILGRVHTIKGDASIVHLTGVVEFAHQLETMLEHIDNGELALSNEAVSIVLAAVDALRDLIARGMRDDHAVRPEERALMARFVDIPQTSARSSGESQPPEARAVLDATGADETGEAPAPKRSMDRAGKDTLRVDIDKLDRLLDLVGEVLIHRGRVGQMLETAESSESSATLEVHREADHLYQDLQELVMQVRMVPVGPTLRQYVRVIRDLCEDQRKYARLVLTGDDVEVDTAIVEKLRAPLTHLVRNAVHHGLESPASRRARGKDPIGTISIHCAHEAGSIVLRVADDGAGIDRASLLRRARALGIEDALDMSEESADELIFAPRLSTSTVVDDLSGRGMGMDIVRRGVEALRGSIAVASEPGVGTEFTVRVPLTMAVIEGFAVGVADETFLIPLDAVVECLAMSAEPRERGRSHGVLDVRGQPVPYARLRRLFGFDGAVAPREHIVLIDCDGMRVGLCVDALLGERHSVIKPLGRLFQSVPLVVGGAILGSGRVALILDIPALVQAILAHAERALPADPPTAPSQPAPLAKDFS